MDPHMGSAGCERLLGATSPMHHFMQGIVRTDVLLLDTSFGSMRLLCHDPQQQ